MKALGTKYIVLPLVVSLLLVLFSVQAGAEAKAAFLYKLSNFSGKVPYDDVRIHADRFHDEVYVLDRGIVRVFDENGMEIYWIGDDPDLGSVRDMFVDEDGDIFFLSYDLIQWANEFFIVRCNYRGEKKDKVTITNLPVAYSRITPNYIFYREGHIYLVDRLKQLVVVTDKRGVFDKGYNFAELLEIPEKDRENTEIFGFSIDGAGNMQFTIPVLFKAYVVSPEGKVAATFGKSGSSPGMFGIVNGIVADDQGNRFVAEMLRSVVMVFDKEYRFLYEFGYRGDKPENLIRPSGMAMGNAGKLYVTQLGRQGVSVFRISPN
jgi:hypothetical protein